MQILQQGQQRKCIEDRAEAQQARSRSQGARMSREAITSGLEIFESHARLFKDEVRSVFFCHVRLSRHYLPSVAEVQV